MAEKASDFVDSKDLNNDENDHFGRVCDLFSPLRERWSLVREVLLWQNIEISVIFFNVINVLFWVFISPRLKIAVGIAILASLLWVIPPLRLWVLSNITSIKLSSKNRRATTNDEIEDSSELTAECEAEKSTGNKMVSYEDFCYGVAVVWKFNSNYWTKLIKIKDENAYKFYGLVVLIIVLVAIVYQRFPVGNILYLTVMFLFLWPSIVFYGIKDKVTVKILKLFKPFLTQWQHSRTKRKRNIVFKDRQKDSDLSDDDDDEDFGLNSSKETEAILSSVLPVNKKLESHPGPFDSMESSTISTEGLEFPSMRRESVESYNSDDFIEGLNFGSFNVDAGSHHSSMDSLHGDETSERQNSNNERIQTTRNEGKSFEKSVAPLDIEQEVRRRREPSPASLSRNKSSDDLQGFEIVETSEIENDTRNNEELESPETSYITSGVGYIGKFFGYS